MPSHGNIGLLLEGLAIFNTNFASVETPDGYVRFEGAIVSFDFFQILDIDPQLGRTFLSREEGDGADAVIVISNRIWRDFFSADDNIIGRTIQLNGAERTIVGVMPSGFVSPEERFFGRSDYWMPLGFDPSASPRNSHWIRTIGRLKPDVSIEDAQTEMSGLMARLAANDPDGEQDHTAVVISLHGQLVGDVQTTLVVLLGAVVLVLAIACTNIGNLMLTRSMTRHHEYAIRIAIGACRARLARQAVAESLLLSLAGAGAGAGLAAVFVPKIMQVTSQLPMRDAVAVNRPVLLFALGVAVVTGVAFGLIPVLRTSGRDPHTLIREHDARGTRNRKRHIAQNTLLVAEVTFSLVLLIGAGLLTRSFVQLLAVDPGYDTNHILTARLDLPAAQDSTLSRRRNDVRAVLSNIGGLAEVRNVGVVTSLPLHGLNNFSLGIVLDGQTDPELSDERWSYYRAISPGYMGAIGIRVKTGRALRVSDNAAGGGALLVNEEFATRYFPGEDPLGHRVAIRYGGRPFDGTIVGVVEHALYSWTQTDRQPEMYVPFDQHPVQSPLFLTIAGHDRTPSLGPRLRAIVRGVNPGFIVDDISTMKASLSRATAQPRINMIVVVGFSVFALLFTTLGLYTVIAYAVAQRTREIGIRMALGAGTHQILASVMKQGFVLIVVGIVLGVVGSLALSRVLSSMLFDVATTDLATFVTVPAGAFVISLIATLAPARRAVRIDPVDALRDD